MEIEVKIPAVAESITEAMLASWVKKTGDFVNLDEIICEVETDKTTLELRAEKPGVLTCKAKEGETCIVGETVIAVIDTSKNAPDQTQEKPKAIQEKVANSKSELKNIQHPSPAASKILAENNLDKSNVTGTGKDGRITKADAIKSLNEQVANTPKTLYAEKGEVTATERNVRREKMSPLRKTIAQRLLTAKHETAMLTTFNEVDMSGIMNARKQFKDQFKEKHGVGLGFMSFFTKAATLAIKEFPAINASVENDHIVYRDYVDLGVAVSTPKGLVVPVVRNAETLSFHQIESEIIRLATKARDSKISIDDISGGTFTITNGGVFGSMLSTPLINYPQSAILGMHNIVERPVGVNGQIVLRPIMYVALSYDHRIIDGRESVGFLKMVKELVENPLRMMLEV